MKKYNENQLLEKIELRETVISRTEVLDNVGELLLLPNTEYATVEQVATYYDVPERTLSDCVNNNKDELMSDGCKVYTFKEVKQILNTDNSYLEKDRKIPNRGLRLLPKRAILRVGMLLRDSEIAKEIRTRLLDIVHDAQEESPEIIQGVVDEINEEKKLMLERVEAEMSGNYDEVSIINAKLFGLKNKRIKELENTNEMITTNSLTIIESRAVINRIVRSIAMKEYSGMFGKAWNELYSKINYKIGINIRARNKKKSESYINTLTEEETFEVEKIVRNWAIAVGLDLDSLLKIA